MLQSLDLHLNSNKGLLSVQRIVENLNIMYTQKNKMSTP